MSELEPFVTVIIPTYKNWNGLKKCLNALSKQSYPKNKFEVFVVNNDPKDTPPFKIDFYNFKLLNEKKIGSYAARNKGLTIASGEIFAFTDSDCIPDKFWLDQGIKALVSDKKNSIVAGCVRIFPKIENNPNIFELFSMLYELNQSSYIKKNRFATANVFIKKSVFITIGNFNSSLKSGADFEFASRAEKKKFLMSYCEACEVSHPARSSYKELKEKAKRKVGGYFSLSKSFLKTFLSILFLLFKSNIEIIRSNFSILNKFKLFIVLIIYFFCKFFELIALTLFNKQVERK